MNMLSMQSVPSFTGSLHLGGGRPDLTFVRVMSTQCLHCHQYIGGAVQFMAVGEPYCGVLHLQCAPLYAFPPHWPHTQPAISYPTH